MSLIWSTKAEYLHTVKLATHEEHSVVLGHNNERVSVQTRKKKKKNTLGTPRVHTPNTKKLVVG